MSEITRELVYGKSPIQRSNPQAGQSEWYYLDPRGAETISEMKQIDVPYEHSPNPYANEIRNYLYNNDKYSYEQLYGNTEPPSNMQQFRKNMANIVRKTGIDKLTKNVYNWGYDGMERLTYPQRNAQNYENKSSLGLAQAAAQRLTPINISDVNKHQYVSCVGSFDGPLSVGATAVAGLYKEGVDLYRKWNNPKYGSNWQIIQDSFKDLKNDAIGISKGWSAESINDCDYLLPSKARRR